MKYRLENISGGQAGTDQTVSAIGNLIQSSLKRPKIRITTLSILESKNVSSHDPGQIAAVIYSWVKRNIAYIQDPTEIETVQQPDITLKLRAGDCDDHSALMAAMLESVGITVRLKVVGHNIDQLVHIYPEALIDGQWLALDTTIQAPMGTAVKLRKSKIYNSKGDVMKSIIYGNGLGRTPVARRIGGLTRQGLYQRFYAKTQQILRNNWNAGRINLQDVEGYLRVIIEGNSPGRGTIAEAPMKKGIADFKRYVIRKNIQSAKPIGALNGLEGLDGFLSSIWKGIKNVAKGAVNLITGGGSKEPIVIQPPVIKLPESLIKTEVTPDAMKSGLEAALSSPILWVAVAALVITVIKK